MINQEIDLFKEVGKEEDVFTKTKLSADSGFHSEKNMKMLADNQFCKRDPRFADYDRFKERYRKERSKHYGRKELLMKKKIDSAAGRLIYSLRVGVVEPPFSHICQVMGLNRFSHRGRKKVNTQWNLFTIVHNMKKIHRYGLELA